MKKGLAVKPGPLNFVVERRTTKLVRQFIYIRGSATLICFELPPELPPTLQHCRNNDRRRLGPMPSESNLLVRVTPYGTPLCLS